MRRQAPARAAMAEQPAASLAPITSLDGFELALSSRSNTGYRNVCFHNGPDFHRRPYHAQVRCSLNGTGAERGVVNLGHYATATEAALAVAKYRTENHGGSAVRKRKQHTPPPVTVVTCAAVDAVEVEGNEDAAVDAVEVEGNEDSVISHRLIQKAQPWHMQALLADFGSSTEGTPEELARRLASQLVRQ